MEGQIFMGCRNQNGHPETMSSKNGGINDTSHAKQYSTRAFSTGSCSSPYFQLSVF